MALEHGMIEPFEDRQVRQGVVSYGLSSYGYDTRVADEFKVFTNVYNTVVDPKHFDPKSFVDIKADVCVIPPNSFALARTIEYFRIPRDILTVCLGKSTYARCGIIVNVTPFEPEWEGHVTIEKSGGDYGWIIDRKLPFKVKCPVDGSVYPTNDFATYYRSGFKEKIGWDSQHVDDGWGAPAGAGKSAGERFWFVAYYNHWMW